MTIKISARAGVFAPAAPHSKSRGLLRRPTSTIVAIALCVGVSIVAVPSAASASHKIVAPVGTSYVALGDSYSAGQGSQSSPYDYIPSSGNCARFTTAYPNVWAATSSLPISLTSVACSGATVATVAASQLSALSPATSLVTLTVGGNDAGFVPVVVACAHHTDCQTAIHRSGDFIEHALPAELTALYSGIRTFAPNAHIVVMGYPNLFGAGPCPQVDPYLSVSVRAQLDGLSNKLHRAISSAAKVSGVSYIDMRQRFAAHGVCSTDPWINGIGADQLSLLHPNTAGQQAYADALARAVSPKKPIGPMVF